MLAHSGRVLPTPSVPCPLSRTVGRLARWGGGFLILSPYPERVGSSYAGKGGGQAAVYVGQLCRVVLLHTLKE